MISPVTFMIRECCFNQQARWANRSHDEICKNRGEASKAHYYLTIIINMSHGKADLFNLWQRDNHQSLIPPLDFSHFFMSKTKTLTKRKVK